MPGEVATQSSHPVGVLIVATVLGEGRLPSLGQQDLGADVAMRRRPSPQHRAQRHLTERRGAAGHGERRLEPEVRRKSKDQSCL